MLLRSSKIAWSLYICLILLPVFAPNLIGASAQTSSKKQPDADIDRLIDQLATVPKSDIEYYPVAESIPFLSDSDECGVLRCTTTHESNVLREIVGLGARALPTLAAHLSDSRPTSSTFPVKGELIVWMGIGKEYDPRHEKNTFDHVADWASGSVKPYTLKVGDLCFEAIGEITNRALHPCRYQPELGLIINSPVLEPELARQTQKDWGHVSATDLEESLVADAMGNDSLYSANAVERLCFLFPKTGQNVAIKLLNRKLYSPSKVSDIWETLDRTEPGTQRGIFLNYVQREGNIYYGATEFAMARYCLNNYFPQEKRIQSILSVFKNTFPNDKLENVKMGDTASPHDQEWLVDGLYPYNFPNVDDALFKLILSFRTLLETTEPTELDTIAQIDHCALRCIDKIGKNPKYSPVLEQYCRERASFLKDHLHPGQAYSDEQKESLQKYQKLLVTFGNIDAG